MLKLSNESDQIISEEELISFKIESKKRLQVKNDLVKLTEKQFHEHALYLHKEIMDLLHHEFKIYGKMRLIICSLLLATLHLSCRLEKLSGKNFLKLKKSWPKNFQNLSETLSQAILSLYQKAQSLN